jgi:aryl-alcohol dehydrogenase-like predicted oxidoreductase
MDRAQQKWLNDGAQLERDAIRRMLNRKYQREMDWVDIEALHRWLDGRTKRYRKAKGGLGR